MSSGFYDQAFFTEQLEVALEELAQASGLQPQEIVELVEYGVFQPSGGMAPGTGQSRPGASPRATSCWAGAPAASRRTSI